MDYARLMDGFAGECGLQPPDTAAGVVVIDVNGIAVSFLDNAPGGALVLHAGIGEAPGGSGGSVARTLLEANAALTQSPGPVFCQDPETKAFALVRSIPLQTADPALLLEAVADLAQTAASWRKRLGLPAAPKA